MKQWLKAIPQEKVVPKMNKKIRKILEKHPGSA